MEGFNLFEIIAHSSLIAKIILFTLVIQSILSIAVIIERMLVYNRIKKNTEVDEEEIDDLIRNKSAAGINEFMSDASRKTNPLRTIIYEGVTQYKTLRLTGETRINFIEEKVTNAVFHELRTIRGIMRNNLSMLANIASSAPFIGLLGTVIGIIATFDAISSAGNMGMNLVASGIADALIATAMGLFAAIPALIAYNIFTTSVADYILELERKATDRMVLIMQILEPRKTQ